MNHVKYLKDVYNILSMYEEKLPLCYCRKELMSKIQLPYFARIKNRFPEIEWEYTPDAYYACGINGYDVRCELNTHIIILESHRVETPCSSKAVIELFQKHKKPVYIIRFDETDSFKTLCDYILQAIHTIPRRSITEKHII